MVFDPFETITLEDGNTPEFPLDLIIGSDNKNAWCLVYENGSVRQRYYSDIESDCILIPMYSMTKKALLQAKSSFPVKIGLSYIHVTDGHMRHGVAAL